MHKVAVTTSKSDFINVMTQGNEVTSSERELK